MMYMDVRIPRVHGCTRAVKAWHDVQDDIQGCISVARGQEVRSDCTSAAEARRPPWTAGGRAMQEQLPRWPRAVCPNTFSRALLLKSNSGKEKTPDTFVPRVSYLKPGSALLSHGKPHTIIGAKQFHFRVRDGIGWYPLAIAARQTGCSSVKQQLKN